MQKNSLPDGVQNAEASINESGMVENSIIIILLIYIQLIHFSRHNDTYLNLKFSNNVERIGEFTLILAFTNAYLLAKSARVRLMLT